MWRKKERETLRLLQLHSEAVLAVVKKFEELIQAFSSFEWEKACCLGREVTMLESQADDRLGKFNRALAGGAFLPAYRGDLARLGAQVDNVADVTEEVSRTLLSRERTWGVMKRERKRTEGLREGMVKMGKLGALCAEALSSSVKTLTSNIDLAETQAKEVGRREHESDLIEQGLIVNLYEREKELDPVTVMQLDQIIHGIGDISDQAEEASHLLLILIYGLRV
jgi:predicted phosphate transport protein (TIGR00153 family)